MPTRSFELNAATFRRASGRWGPLLLIVLTGAVMLAWTWGTWPDVLIDFGRELYVPWQLAKGKVLYRDIAYFNGPLSPYVNMVWFRLFGATLRTLVWCNVAIIVAITAMIYALFRRLGDRWAATGTALAFLLLFAFARYEWVGNSNFVCPYSHETTHGVALALAMLLLLDRYLRGSRAALAGAGLILGLIFLTKVEIFVAAALAALAAVTLCRKLASWRIAGDTAIDPVILLATCLIAPLIAWGALSLAMPGREALLGTLGSWHYTFNTRLSTLLYFKTGTGLLNPVDSLRRLFLASLGIAVFLLLMGLPSWSIGRARRPSNLNDLHASLQRVARAPFDDRTVDDRRALFQAYSDNWWTRTENRFSVVFAILYALILIALWRIIPWLQLPRPLPLVMLALGVVAVLRWRRAADPDQRARATLLLVTAVFAFAMLLKMILDARLSNYGYFLALPAMLLSITALLTWIPQWLARHRGVVAFFRTPAIAALLVFAAWYLSLTAFHFRELTVRVSRGANAFYAGGRGAQVNEAVHLLNAHLGPGQTVAVLPEGAMINFLANRVNPTPYIIFMPSDLIMFGEDRVIAAFNAHPPDYILLAHKDTSEYGFRFFGQDYGQGLMAWVNQHYEFAGRVGDEPFTNEKFGIKFMRLRAPP